MSEAELQATMESTSRLWLPWTVTSLVSQAKHSAFGAALAPPGSRAVALAVRNSSPLICCFLFSLLRLRPSPVHQHSSKEQRQRAQSSPSILKAWQSTHPLTACASKLVALSSTPRHLLLLQATNAPPDNLLSFLSPLRLFLCSDQYLDGLLGVSRSTRYSLTSSLVSEESCAA